MKLNRRRDDLHGIAVIGMAGRFPGAPCIAEFWSNIANGIESISFSSAKDLIADGVDASVIQSDSFVSAGGILEGADLFDAGFFGYTPREAESIDPQQRVFLECAWEALEDAGYAPDRFPGSIGVFAGCAMSSYFFLLLNNPAFIESVGYLQALIGNDKDYLSNRVSYKLNLTGPAITVQSACSTSLVAIALAAESLGRGECDMALAGGVNIRVPQRSGYHYQSGGILSPDGHCRPFDAAAAGTVFGNGVGVVILKRLSDAIKDRDLISAVIRGYAINNDGHDKVGFTAPSIRGQAEVIRKALSAARVKSDTISFVETHGTGTLLGDPIEVTALTEAFRDQTDQNGFCAIGSIKANVGHLDPAAGVTGFLKAVLALKHRQIPPSVNYSSANPEIEFQETPFYVNTDLREWTPSSGIRRAGVSAFGIGGTNCHVVLEEVPKFARRNSPRSCQLVLLSARSTKDLDGATVQLADHVRDHPDLALGDIAYTLAVGRHVFPYRRMMVATDREQTIKALQNRDPRHLSDGIVKSQPRAVFMFPGQGNQYVGMGADLYRSEPSFRAAVDECAEVLKPHLGLDLREIIYPKSEAAAAAQSALEQTALTQPALFTVEYALAKLLMDFGLHPNAMIGHSVGEYVAACIAGVFSLRSALKLVAYRGHLMQKMPTGSMLAVPLSEKEIQNFVSDRIALAAVNEPSICVLSGPTDDIDEVFRRLK